MLPFPPHNSVSPSQYEKYLSRQDRNRQGEQKLLTLLGKTWHESRKPPQPAPYDSLPAEPSAWLLCLMPLNIHSYGKRERRTGAEGDGRTEDPFMCACVAVPACLPEKEQAGCGTHASTLHSFSKAALETGWRRRRRLGMGRGGRQKRGSSTSLKSTGWEQGNQKAQHEHGRHMAAAPAPIKHVISEILACAVCHCTIMRESTCLHFKPSWHGTIPHPTPTENTSLSLL